MKGASLSPSHEVCERRFAWLAAGALLDVLA